MAGNPERIERGQIALFWGEGYSRMVRVNVPPMPTMWTSVEEQQLRVETAAERLVKHVDIVAELILVAYRKRLGNKVKNVKGDGTDTFEITFANGRTFKALGNKITTVETMATAALIGELSGADRDTGR